MRLPVTNNVYAILLLNPILVGSQFINVQYPMGTSGSFPSGKADNSHSSITEIKDEFHPPNVFIT